MKSLIVPIIGAIFSFSFALGGLFVFINNLQPPNLWGTTGGVVLTALFLWLFVFYVFELKKHFDNKE